MADPSAGYPPPTEQAAYPPLPEQGGYPPQPGYPPQEAYPPQPGYPPQEAYPQQQPPPQAYPPQPQVEHPPPYYPQPPPTLTQTDKTNVVVVQSQPQVVTTTRYHIGTSDVGTGALIFAISSSVCVFFFCCSWLSLICTIPAIIFALNANNAQAAGNLAQAQSQRNLSYGFTIAGLVTGVIWLIIIIAVSA